MRKVTIALATASALLAGPALITPAQAAGTTCHLASDKASIQYSGRQGDLRLSTRLVYRLCHSSASRAWITPLSAVYSYQITDQPGPIRFDDLRYNMRIWNAKTGRNVNPGTRLIALGHKGTAKEGSKTHYFRDTHRIGFGSNPAALRWKTDVEIGLDMHPNDHRTIASRVLT